MILMPSKLRRKVLLKFFILIIAISFSFIAIFISHQVANQKGHLVEEGLAFVRLLAQNSRLGVLTENPEFLKDITDSMMQRKEVVSIQILSSDGKILAQQGRPEASSGIINNMSKEPYYIELPDDFEFRASVITHSNSATGSQLFMDSAQTEQVSGYVRLAISKDGLLRNSKALLIRGVTLAVIFSIIGFFIAYFASKNITGPIAKLKEWVATIEEGDLDAHISIRTNDEIEDLGAAINRMAQSLKAREAEKVTLMEHLCQAQSLDAIGRFSAGVAHDFNNILTIIRSNLELADSKSPEYIRGYLEKSINASDRGRAIIKNLLSFARKAPAEQELLNIGFITSGVVKMLSATIDQKIKLNIDIEPNLWKTMADSGQVQQVVMNLILNAQDAIRDCMEDDATKDRTFGVDIATKNVHISKNRCSGYPQAAHGDYILLSVEDNGSGMDKVTMSHIFEPFFTTKKPTFERKSGLGLGLPTVHGIVKRLNGWIDVKSEQGQGTSFNIYFPRFAGEDKDIEHKAEPGNVAGGTEAILLVDDEEHILDALKEKLEDLGYKVSTANNGETALNMLGNKRKKFDLIVLDQIMPGMTGIEVLKNIEEMKLKTHILIYSGQDLSQYESLLEGVTLVSKPYSLDALADKIREILGYEWKNSFKTQISRVKLHYASEKTAPYEEQVTDNATIYKLFRHLASEPRETFIAVYLDPQQRIIAYDQLSTGTTDKAAVYPKEVVRSALLTNASSVILVHNHPSGNIKPSKKDIVITAAIEQACEVMELRVQDHIIVSKKGYFSFLDEGLMR